MGLALSTVIYEWRRYLAAVIALALSGMLVLCFLGMFQGIGKSFTAIIDRSRADLIIMPENNDSMLHAGTLPRRIMPVIYANPDVLLVSDMILSGGMFSNLAGKRRPGVKKFNDYVMIWAVDTTPGALTLPTDFDETLRQTLSEPYAVAIDRSEMPKIGVKLGDHAAIEGRAVRIAAVLDKYPNVMQPQIIVSNQTLRLLGKAPPDNQVGPLFVRLRDPSRAEVVRDQLNAVADGRFRAWTKTELSKANEGSIMHEQGIGLIVGFTTIMGMLIGLGITSQTLRGAILANIKELSSLRALGVSLGALRRVVIELSFWVGVAGLLCTGLLTFVVSQLAGMAGVPMAFPLASVLQTAFFLLLTSVLSGVLSLGVLARSEPADLLR